MAEVLTWNVAGRVRSVPAQAAALAQRPVAVLALQEVRVSALALWREALEGQGYRHVLTSWDEVDPAAVRTPQRRLGVLLAAREPLERLRSPVIPWPERHLAAAVQVDGLTAVVHTLHAPLSSREDQVKVRTLEAVAEQLRAPDASPVVLTGDLNTPQYESREGEVRSFARTRSGRVRPLLGERHDRAELALVPGLADAGYTDAFRAVHGYAARDRSWLYPTGKTGFRLDHIFVRGLRPVDCSYVHAWREEKLSDHSALWARLAGA